MGKKKDSENIRVAIRCRDLLPYEMERGDKAVVRMDLATSQVVIQHAIGDPETYAFDAVFNNTFTQRDIFVQEVQPLVDAVMQGYNATVFAYGQSGSGKTHTMTGKLSDPSLWGMMPQVVDLLFTEIKKQTTSTKNFKVKVSYIELYNGKSRDLLARKQVNLEIKQNMAKNFYVKGADTPEVTSFDECIRWFNEGTERRQVASTDLNDQSSRSHSLFSLTVEQYDFEQDPSTPVIMSSKINVVDLAGSEKLGKTNATGDTAKEGANINLSLSALATVIDTIVKGGKHIPYRGSALTMLLKDSLGGNSKTVMFANVGPSDKNISETISTLRFALRAKQITNKPVKNLDPKDARIQELLDKIEELQARMGNVDLNEEERLKAKIEELEVENAELRGSQEKDNIELEELCKSKTAQIEQLVQALKERDSQLQNAAETRAIAESNMRADLEHMAELKNITTNFLKRSLTQDQLHMIRDRMPREGDYNLTDENWDVKEIQFYLEGFTDMYEGWRRSNRTDEDVTKMIEKAREEVATQFQQQLNDAVRDRDELLRQRTEENTKRHGDSEAQSHLKVEFNALREENTKLRDKIERDQEKFKKKLEKLREEQRAVSEEMENYKAEVGNKDREIEKLKKLLESGAGAPAAGGAGGAAYASAGGSGSPMKIPAGADPNVVKQLEEVQRQKVALESRLKETNVALRRKGFCLQEGGNASNLMPGGVPPPPSGEGGETSMQPDVPNDAFILAPAEMDDPVDTDLLGQLQQQIRVQHRLQELRHVHQRKLDDMVRKFELVKTGKVTVNSAEEAGGVSEEMVNAKVQEALAAKENELAELRTEHERISDKLVKKFNKKVAEFKENEAKLHDEIQGLQEERVELITSNDELTKFNTQMALEIENLRAQYGIDKQDADNEVKLRENEIAHLKNQIIEVSSIRDSYRARADEYENLQTEFQRLHSQNQRTESSLKEKAAALENHRQMTKWSNSLLETEKEKVGALEGQIRLQEQQFKEMEENWRSQLIENANKLVAINNKRLEEQAAQYQNLVSEEQENTKKFRDKLKKAKSQTQKAAQRYDEMVLENETLQAQFEDLKVSAMKIYLEKQQNDMDGVSDNIRNMIRSQQRDLDKDFGRPQSAYRR